MKKAIFLCLFLAGIVSVNAQEKKVLFVMSAAKELPLKNGKTYTNTGVFLSEFYLAYKGIIDLGYSVDFATPMGEVSSIDKESYEKKYWKGQENLLEEAITFVKNNHHFNHPLPLEEALQNASAYAGLVVPGGQGLMVDLMKDARVPGLLLSFAQDNKCVGLICHAPALLTTIAEEENPFRGYRVNSVTGMEEFFIENFVMKGKPYNRKIGKQLKGHGFTYKKGRPAKNFAVRDRNLVTSQNPFSNDAFSRLYLQALKDYELTSQRQ
jgi:putative intracellular protease/amidase